MQVKKAALSLVTQMYTFALNQSEIIFQSIVGRGLILHYKSSSIMRWFSKTIPHKYFA